MNKEMDGKVRFDLITPGFEEGLAMVLTHGLTKYDAHSWKTVDADLYYGALRRHISDHRKAMLLDDVPIMYFDTYSTLLHIDHAVCNLMFLRWKALEQVEVCKKLSKAMVSKSYLR